MKDQGEKMDDEVSKLPTDAPVQAHGTGAQSTPATHDHVLAKSDAENKLAMDPAPQTQVPLPNATNDSTGLIKTKWSSKGASRMAGYMFWTNSAAVLLLLIGFAAPGWMTINPSQELFHQSYSSYDDSGSRTKYTSAYQDYALWYFTQCVDTDREAVRVCQTMSYRTVRALGSDQCSTYECAFILIGSMRIEDASGLMHFAYSALAFSYSDIVRAQALYTVSLVLALATLLFWYKFRRGVSEEKVTGLNKKKWICLFFLSVLSATFTFVPVFELTGLSSQIRGYSGSDDTSPVGIVFAGCGGGMMVMCIGAILMHLVCCGHVTDAYIRTSETDNVTLVPVGEEEEV